MLLFRPEFHERLRVFLKIAFSQSRPWGGFAFMRPSNPVHNAGGAAAWAEGGILNNSPPKLKDYASIVRGV
jgi:hypothetical protein